MSISKNNSIFNKLKEQNVLNTGEALDLGCGKGGDARAFSKEGFNVTAVDSLKKTVELINNEAESNKYNIKAICSLIENFNITPNTYSLISAQYVLHFLEKNKAKEIIQSMIEGATFGGIISFTLIGEKDEWKDKWSVWNKSEALNFLETFPIEIRNIIEEEGFDATKAGPLKWWHVLTFVLIKK